MFLKIHTPSPSFLKIRYIYVRCVKNNKQKPIYVMSSICNTRTHRHIHIAKVSTQIINAYKNSRVLCQKAIMVRTYISLKS